MKEVKEMNQQELTQYFLEKKMKGANFREISNIFQKNEIDASVRQEIMVELNKLDKEQKIALEKLENKAKTRTGYISIIIGILIGIFGFIMFFATAKQGVVFYFNFALWFVAAGAIIKGLINIVAGHLKL
jgi:uncharacterized membrane protein (DUF106 family)